MVASGYVWDLLALARVKEAFVEMESELKEKLPWGRWLEGFFPDF